jgi:hypothetical protein
MDSAHANVSMPLFSLIHRVGVHPRILHISACSWSLHSEWLKRSLEAEQSPQKKVGLIDCTLWMLWLS